MHASLMQMLQRLPAAPTGTYPEGAPFVRALAHGSMSVELYAPGSNADGRDRQQPHAQDELYVVQVGRATLRIGAEHFEAEPGDVLFVPAGADHCFDLIVQQCAQGLIAIRRHGDRLAFAAPPSTRSEPAPELLAQVVQALGIDAAQVRRAQLLDNGPAWLTLQLDSADTVLALVPDQARLASLGMKVGVVGLHAAAVASPLIGRSSREARAFSAAAGRAPAPLIEVRAFAAPIGVAEDPVTGSLNASLAQWLIEAGELPARYVAAQGTALGRAGRVHVERDADGQVWVGGDCVRVISGEVRL